MTFADYNSHTNQLFINQKILKMDDIIKTQQLKLIYEFKNNILPSDLMNLFKTINNVYNYETRSNDNKRLFIPEILTTTYGTKSLKYQGPLLWNKISKTNPKINEIKSSKRLKYVIKSHYLASYEE